MRFDNDKLKSMLREKFTNSPIFGIDFDEEQAVEAIVEAAFSIFQTFLIQGTLAAAKEKRDG